MFRHMHGIRIGRLNKGATDATIFEGIDIGLSTQDFERLVGVEPRGRTLAGLTVVQRAELELRRAEWAEKLRERKPPGADDSDTEDEDCCGGGGEEAAEKVKMTPEEKLAAEKANALLNQRRRRNCNAMVKPRGNANNRGHGAGQEHAQHPVATSDRRSRKIQLF